MSTIIGRGQGRITIIIIEAKYIEKQERILFLVKF
jgi:hypothetical protein